MMISKKLISEYKPDMVGVSCIDSTYWIARSLLESIKDFRIFKTMGGIGVTFLVEEVIKELFIDVVCIGEGEEAIVELADKLAKNKDYTKAKVKNLLKTDFL